MNPSVGIALWAVWIALLAAFPQQPQGEVQKPQGSLVKFAHYLNDKEQPSQSCEFSALVQGKVIAPVSTEGNRRTYDSQFAKQDLLIRCGEHVASGPSQYNIFEYDKYGYTIVFEAYTQPKLLQREFEFGPLKFDDHYSIAAAHYEGRWSLRKTWLELPKSKRNKVKVAYSLTTAVGGVEGISIWFR